MEKLFLAVAMLVATFGSSAAAQSLCGPYTTFATQLNAKYGEALRDRGTTESTVMEVWTNPTSGSWTILERFADGTSCVRADGENFVTFEPEIPGKGT